MGVFGKECEVAVAAGRSLLWRPGHANFSRAMATGAVAAGRPP